VASCPSRFSRPASKGDPWSTSRSPAPTAQGLYDPAYEHDACGVGFVARLDGVASHDIVEKGLEVLRNLDHRRRDLHDDRIHHQPAIGSRQGLGKRSRRRTTSTCSRAKTGGTVWASPVFTA